MKNAIELSLVMVALCSMTGCTENVATEPKGATKSDIIHGRVDLAHPAAVAIRWQVTTSQGTFGSLCTGTLIAARTVLTAGHCVVPAEAGMTFKNHEVYFGMDAGSPTAKWLKAVGTVAHPNYSTTVFGAYDVAVVLLAADAPVAPVQVASAIPDLTGSSVTHVGFGTTVSVTSQLKFGAGGLKFDTTLPVTEQSNITLRTGNGSSGICNGDSGGPAFLSVNGADVVVGVHSYIDDNQRCLGNGYSARTDISFDFISLYGASGVALN